MAREKELARIIADFQERDILSNCANLANFLNLSEIEQVVYLGIDCTADSLHIGHLLPFMQAVRLASVGFKIKLLLGGATSKVGDPSDKSKERPLIDHQTLLSNQGYIQEQLTSLFSRNNANLKKLRKKPLYLFFPGNQKLLSEIYKVLGLHESPSDKSFEKLWWEHLNAIWPASVSDGSFEIVNNQDWLAKLTFIDFIDNYGRNITVNYLLSKETIRQRIASGNGLSFSAFTYSLLQAYDFFYLYKNYRCHGQIGASDQWGNFTTGLKMINTLNHNNRCFTLTFKLILDEKGKKISKSENSSGMVWLTEKKTALTSLFNYFSNMSDERALQYIKKFTFLSADKIELLLNLNKPASLRILQRILTEFFFFLIHGKEGLLWLHKNAIVNQKSGVGSF